MNQTTAYDALLAQTWRSALSTLLSSVRAEEDRLTLPATWAVSALLEAELSSRESPIRDYLVSLDNWAKELETIDGLLEESSTGLLGLWLYLRHQQRKRVKGRLEKLFLRSVEHNLQRRKDLSLGRNVKLLNAVAAGLGYISKAEELRVEVSECLQELSQNTNALEMVQMLRSWELLQRTDDIPRLGVQHRFESIASDENNAPVERAMAYYGQLRMAELFDKPRIEYEMRLLDCLGLAGDSNQHGSGPMVKAYVLSLPYLKRRMSYDSLFEAWQRYTDSSFKRAKTENYLARCLFVISIASLISIMYWPWFRQLDSGFQVSIGSAMVTTILMLIAFTIQTVSDLYGRQFWQKGKVEIAIGLLGSLVALSAVLVETLLR